MISEALKFIVAMQAISYHRITTYFASHPSVFCEIRHYFQRFF